MAVFFKLGNFLSWFLKPKTTRQQHLLFGLIDFYIVRFKTALANDTNFSKYLPAKKPLFWIES